MTTDESTGLRPSAATLEKVEAGRDKARRQKDGRTERPSEAAMREADADEAKAKPAGGTAVESDEGAAQRERNASKTRTKRGPKGARAGKTKPAAAASTSTNGGATISAREAAIRVLKAAGGPLDMKDIVERVLKTKGVKLTGKTPAATIAAIVSSHAKKGKTFKKVGRARYDLLER